MDAETATVGGRKIRKMKLKEFQKNTIFAERKADMTDEQKLINDLNQVIQHIKDKYGTELTDSPINQYVQATEDTILRIERRVEIDKNGWIPCSDRMPDEHDSIFAKFKNTEQWNNSMFEKCSNDVNVTVEFEDGTKMTKTTHTIDGVWKVDKFIKQKIIAWQPLPEPWEGK